MDDLDKAILISFDESGSMDPALKLQASSYIQSMRESASPSSIVRLCVERLSLTGFVQVQFWCLQSIHDCLRLHYPSVSPEDLSFLRKTVVSIACCGDGVLPLLNSPAFIKNKFAQVFVSLICHEYPSIWPSPFLDVLACIGKGALVIDGFCRILNALDDELISLDYPRSSEEYVIAARVKDAMRQQCIPQIVWSWYDVVSRYRGSDPTLTGGVLDTMRRYIGWIDIGLVANDAFVPLFFDLILSEGTSDLLRASASGCVLAVVVKRMEPRPKLELLRSLQINRLLGLVEAEDADSEFASRLAELIAGYAGEVLDCHKRLGAQDTEGISMERLGAQDTEGISMELLDKALPSVFYIMRNIEVESPTFNAIQFLSGYVSTMKSLSPLGEKQMMHVGEILDVIRFQITFDPMHRENLDLPNKIGQEEEDMMAERRRDLFALLRSVSRVAPDATQLFIRNSLAGALACTSPEKNVEEAEAALSLFYRLSESVSEEEMRSGGRFLGEMVQMLLSARLPCHGHRIVALVYLETIVRYLKFVQDNQQYIPLVLSAFLDERGIHHSNLSVRQRANYLFMRVVKLLKAKLVPYIDMILQGLQDSVARFTGLDWTSKDMESSGMEDESYTFEAIGLLIGMEDVSPEKQTEYLSALLNPLCQQVKVDLALLDSKGQMPDESSTKIASIQQIIMAINALSKGFSERLITGSRPGIGAMFKQTLDILLRILVVFPNNEPLRNKTTSFLHRMVSILGTSVFPYLPMALEQLLVDSEPKELVDFLVLINQLICKFNTSVGGILEELFPAIASRFFHILPKDVPSGPGSNTEEIRELQELQKTLYTFLHVMATHDLSSVFLAPKSRGYLDAIMQLLLYSSCSHRDIPVRKLCVQIFVKLIKEWCPKYNGEEKVPGFRSFIIETFATNCCLNSVLDKSFEFRDANTLILFGEIVTAQKVMYEKFGNDFLIHFVSKCFPAAHCPQNLVEQYYEKLQGSDIKALKSAYQSLIENLRQQQNGSLVFR
ncbi:Exportin-T [Acorus calamus]|uniref:Exportin-T n=1 Tax=Acorus calamus TaxID=4465 RepID=A0AAV9CGL7_ACOCL|nr:Exportin-T [Acorus calamus]